jgi:hypothetical protein
MAERGRLRSTAAIGGRRLAVVASDESSVADDFDVVLVHGKTVDGAGARVLRARPGRFETGEVRPLEQGRPIAPGAQVVQLTPRDASPHLFDVKVEYEVEGKASAGTTPLHGPAQVATPAYRESWERTFGAPSSKVN